MRTKVTCILVCSVVASAFFAGCGGGGGGPVSLPGACTTASFTPNYAQISELQHWPGFPLRVFLGATDSNTKALTLDGFDQWVAATNGRVSYVLVTRAADADIAVKFGLNNGSNDTLGITTTTFRGSVIQHADIEFFYVPPSQNNATRINRAVAAHEFGHALGIGLHSPNAADLMFTSTDGSNNRITTRDLNTLLTAYCDSFPQRVTGPAPSQPNSSEPVQTRTISTRKR